MASEPNPHDTETSHIAQDIEGYLAQHERKELLRFVAVGSVDDGKSTLIGRLLHDTQGVYDDQLAAVKRASAKKDEDIDFSLFTDGLKAEREQGITIDVAYRYFTTAKRKFIIADTPGHVQYTRNMATGASTADVAIILLDARLGVLPQSKRHAYIASLLGIPQLVVCVNKMDLVEYAQGVFDTLRAEFGEFVAKLGFTGVYFLPISAKKGDNVVAKSERTPWFDGHTLLAHLETVPIARDREREELRFPVQYVLRPHLNYRGFAGTLASGVVRKGDEVVVLPSRRKTRVRAIDTYEGEVESAFAPMSVTLRLADEVDISRGDMLVHEGALPRVATRFEATLVWLDTQPMDPSRGYLLKHTTRVVPARIERVAWKTDHETLAPVATERLELNEIGRVVVRCNRPLFVDAYTKNRVAGAFVLVDPMSNGTVAAGMVLEVGEGSDDRDEARAASRVTALEREEGLGQSGAVVWVEGGAREAAEYAVAIERALFDSGRVATIVEGAADVALEVSLGCAAAGVIAVCVAAGAASELRDALRERAGEQGFVTVRASEGASAQSVIEALGARGRF